MTIYRCSACDLPYPPTGLPHVCPACGALFEAEDINYPGPAGAELTKHGMWAYRQSFGLAPDAPEVWLGEGATALVSRQTSWGTFWFKCEQFNPSGSFKDRGSSILVSVLRQRGVTRVIEDSSGNAGASLSLYCAANQIENRIYVPASASGVKRRQIEAVGSNIIAVPGPRENAHQMALKAVSSEAIPYASHALLPFGISGYATIFFEILEQLGQAPGTIVAPVGHGSLFLGLLLGAEAAARWEGRPMTTQFLGVQPENCAPLVAHLLGKPFSGMQGSSVAEGTQIEQPVRGDEIMLHLKKGRDQMISVTDSEILQARTEITAMGFYVEPTSAMVWAAVKRTAIDLRPPVVLVLTGSGLKS